MKLIKRLTMTTKPISLNATGRAVKGRVISSKPYRDFKLKFGWEIKSQFCGESLPIVRGKFGIVIQIGRKQTKADIDNLIKPIVDLLAGKAKDGGLEILPNDRNMEFVNISRIDGKISYIEIHGKDQGDE